jgi:transglutaminase-like putative cysteine protease
MKFYLHHTTQYSYSNPVIESANKILLYPFNDMNQQLANHKLTISGNPNVFTYLDDYNNQVGFFTYVPPHKKLLISSEAEIISKKIVLPEEKTNTKDQWKTIEEIGKTIDYLPFLSIEKIEAFEQLNDLLNEIIDKKHSPLENVKSLCDYINKSFNYQKGVTNVFTTIDEVWKLKSGVCQDFTNILIQLCRMVKIPTRYVSGYVFADEGLRGAGATHAWVEIFIPTYGWLGLDPTNNCIADQFHIRLAVGRNYNDCAPVKGVFKGNETQLMDVKVHLDNKRKTKNLELLTQDSVALETHQSSTQNSYRRNLEMIQQQQQQQQQ